MEIGFIGLGKMGQAIVGHLLSNGHTVSVWNRSPEPVKAMVAKGAKAVANPAELAKGEFLLTILSNDAAVRQVILDQGVLDAATPKLVHMNLTTASVALGKEFAELHKQRNVGYLAAPVFGRPDAAAAGQLNVVVGGEAATIERAQPVLKAIGHTLWPVGPAEAANAVKISGNFMIASAIEAMGEAVALTRAHGIEADKFLQILTETLFNCRVYKGYGAMIAAEKYTPAGFEVPLALKDVRLALAAADAHNVPMPLASLIRDNYMELMANGHSDKDWGALALLAARRAGL